jgi:hypothetical protein
VGGQERALHARHVSDQNAMADRAQQRRQGLRGRRRGGQILGAQAVDLDRARGDPRRGPHQSADGTTRRDAPFVDRDRGVGDHLVALGVESGGLDVDHDEAGGTP